MKTRGRLQPALVVGMGAWGARVVSDFGRRLEHRAGDASVVRAAVLVEDNVETSAAIRRLSVGQTADLIVEMEATRRLDAVQAARRVGWDVDAKMPTVVTLVAALNDEEARERALQVARSLCATSTRNVIQRPMLGGVFLFRPGQDGDDAEQGADLWSLVPDREPFDAGCYLLGRTNADGLLLFDGEEEREGERRAQLVACWLELCALTGLDAALARAPLDETAGYQAFGVASWDFPLEALKGHLARRWQAEVLDRLLASPQHPGASPVSFLERHVQSRTPWPKKTTVPFQVTGETGSPPALRLVPTLRTALDQVVALEQERLQEAIARAERRIEEIDGEIDEALAEATRARLDEAGLADTQRFLKALGRAVERRIVQCEQAVEQHFARLEALDVQAGQAAETLDEYTKRFPPFRLRVLLGLILRPWRLVRLWLLYREIGRRAVVYLSYCQSRWQLQVEAFKHQWRAALYARLAQAIQGERDDVMKLTVELERLRNHQAPGAELERGVIRSLEDAALPEHLVDQFYRRAVGDESADAGPLLALHGPLSMWVREGFRADVLGAFLLDHAREVFAFLDEVRLDDLLARTRSGVDLRRHLAALIEAAVPWWVAGETEAPSKGQGEGRRVTLVGLPDAERSPLSDLLPRRHVCFSTGDRRRVIAVQVTRGIRKPSEKGKEGEG